MPEDDVRITARLEPDVHGALVDFANDQDRSMNHALNAVLRSYLFDQDPPAAADVITGMLDRRTDSYDGDPPPLGRYFVEFGVRFHLPNIGAGAGNDDPGDMGTLAATVQQTLIDAVRQLFPDDVVEARGPFLADRSLPYDAVPVRRCTCEEAPCWHENFC